MHIAHVKLKMQNKPLSRDSAAIFNVDIPKRPRAPFTKMASSSRFLSDPDLRMDFDEVPHSPLCQLKEGTTSATEDD